MPKLSTVLINAKLTRQASVVNFQVLSIFLFFPMKGRKVSWKAPLHEYQEKRGGSHDYRFTRSHGGGDKVFLRLRVDKKPKSPRLRRLGSLMFRVL